MNFPSVLGKVSHNQRLPHCDTAERKKKKNGFLISNSCKFYWLSIEWKNNFKILLRLLNKIFFAFFLFLWGFPMRDCSVEPMKRGNAGGISRRRILPREGGRWISCNLYFERHKHILWIIALARILALLVYKFVIQHTIKCSGPE